MEEALSTELFYGMILSGAKQVIHTEGELNQLNVFPVADRDTGTNLASMMSYIVDNLSITKDTQELVHQLSQHGLVGCCGNSGLIFSQFFYGLTQHRLTEKTKVKLQDFVEMISQGYKSAYNSVSNPKPGTILTVMEKWVDSYRESISNAKVTLTDSFSASVQKAKEALRETMNQLEVLRANKVVDAGAQGFVNFLDGMLKFLTVSKEQRERILAESHQNDSLAKINHEFEDVTEFPNYRYCFETVIKTPNQDALVPLQDKLNSYGDSMVIGKGPQMLKLHIHTDKPEQVTAMLAKVGDVLYQKIDDMQLQYNIANRPHNSNIAIVADSLADIPVEFMQQNNIYRIPLQVKVNGHSFLDKISINYQQTLNYLEDSRNRVGTAAPSAAIVARSLHFLEQFYDSVIVISVGKSLSSTYDVIVNQARKVKNRIISVIDSKLNSAPLGLLVAYANQLVKNGASHEEVLTKVEAARSGANVLIMLNSLEGLVRSGRLSKSMGFIAKLLRLKPLISIDEQTGKPKVIGAVFTKRGGWKKLTAKISELKAAGKLKSIAIVHSESTEHAHTFSKYVKRHTGLTPLYVTEVSSVSGIHTDKNSFSIGYINQDVSLD